MSASFKKCRGGVCAPRGFVAGAVSASIKPEGKPRDDFSLVYSESPAVAAATFTTNRVKAAPVRISMEHLRHARTRAVVLNSGNANACTGDSGMEHARRTAHAVARALQINDREVLVCSTGRIGIPLPIARMEEAVPDLVATLSRRGNLQAARAIMTSDTVSKEVAFQAGGKNLSFRIGGMAKGAGMIDPHMATMLAVLTTDALISKPLLSRMLRLAVSRSFNRITVDGDMSTNDTVILLANGQAEGKRILPGSPEAALFQSMLDTTCRALARKIVEDGEGTTRVIEVEVEGASSERQARLAAEAVANSSLVKCAWAGGDPNWGRILDALGYSGAVFDPEKVDIFYDDLPVAQGGAASSIPFAQLKRIAQKKSFCVQIRLHHGSARYEVLTTDLTEEYVRLNLGE